MFNKTEIMFLKTFAHKDMEDKFSVYSTDEINGVLNIEYTFEQIKDMLKDLQAKGVLVVKYAVNNEFCFGFTRQAFIELEHFETDGNLDNTGAKATALGKKGKPKVARLKALFYAIGALSILTVGFLSGLLGGYVASLI